jgi:putative flippase GtrA
MNGPKQRRLAETGWRYTLVGLACALSNYVVMIAVDRAGGHYLLGTIISFLIVTPLAYALHSWFTFSVPFGIGSFLRFAGSVALTYPIAVAMLAVLCTGLGLDVAVAVPLATLILFAWNFVAARWAILPRLELDASALPRAAAGRQP